MARKKEFKRKRTVIVDNKYRLAWMVQRGGEAIDALHWYEKKMQAELTLPHEVNLERNLGYCGYIRQERDGMLWFHEDAGSGTIAHEVFHASVRLSQLLGTPINPETEEVFAHYTSWLVSEIVGRLWWKK